MCDTASDLRLLEVSQAGASSLADAVAAVNAADDVNVSRYGICQVTLRNAIPV